MERDSSRGRTQLAATLIAHGEQRPSGREVDTEFLGRRGPWDVSMVVVGTATRVSGNARSSCCKLLDVQELQSMFTCVYTT